MYSKVIPSCPRIKRCLAAMLSYSLCLRCASDAGIMSGSISDIALDLSLSSGQEAAAMAVLNVVAGIGALGAGAVRASRDTYINGDK